MKEVLEEAWAGCVSEVSGSNQGGVNGVSPVNAGHRFGTLPAG